MTTQPHKTLAEIKVYKTNAALGHQQYAFLIRLDKSKNGFNYLCIDLNCETDVYRIGELVEDLHDIYIEDSLYPINGNHLCKSFLFQQFLASQLVKKDEVSSDVEQAAKEFSEEIFAGQGDYHESGQQIGRMEGFIQGAKYQSTAQQPAATINFFSDEEIEKEGVKKYPEFQVPNLYDEGIAFVSGAKWLQSKLKERVNCVDPVDFLKWVHLNYNYYSSGGLYMIRGKTDEIRLFSFEQLQELYIEQLKSKP